MRHCREDADSVLVGIQKLADALTDWAKGYMEAGVERPSMVSNPAQNGMWTTLEIYLTGTYTVPAFH